MQRKLVLCLAIVALPLVAACSGGATSTGASAADGKVTLTALDTMKFTPANITVKAGQPVQLTLENKGKVVHDVLVDAAGQPVAIAVQPGDQGTASFTITQPGTYGFYCAQAGHREAGMKGTITVQ
jgi:uncharacterized cupredoxin-like copper-binding protein